MRCAGFWVRVYRSVMDEPMVANRSTMPTAPGPLRAPVAANTARFTRLLGAATDTLS